VIIDCHTHLCLDEPARRGVDLSAWLARLDDQGIDGAVVCGCRGLISQAELAADNELLSRAARLAPERLFPFGTVHPFASPNALEDAENCVRRLGMKGIKLHPWVQGFPNLLGKEVQDLCDLCGGLRVPLLFHDGTPNVSMPSQVAELARAHQKTTFVLGHAGLMHLWRQAAEVARLYGNVYITLCGPHPAAMRHIVRTVPVERVLWGSDYGFGVSRHLLGYRKRLVSLLDLSESARKAIMGENAARLLGWSPAGDMCAREGPLT